MSIPGLGHLSSLRIGKEATYGTAPGSATAKYDIANFRIGANQSTMKSPNMNSQGASSHEILQGLQFITFGFDIALGFEGYEELWRWILPSYAQAAVGGDATVKDNTFKELTSLLGYTFENSFGNIPAGKVTRLVGCYCTGIDLPFQAVAGDGGQLVIKCTGAGWGPSIANQTPMGGTPTVPVAYGIPFHAMLRTTGNLKDGSGLTETDIYLRSVGLSLKYPHNTQRAYLGSVNANSPVRNGAFEVRIECEAEWDALNYVLHDKLTQNLPAAGGLKFLFQHGATIGTSSKREFEIIASSPVSAGYDLEIPGPDVITQRYAWDCKWNPTDASAIKVRTRNLLAALA